MFKMRQWDFDFYIPGRRVYWKRAILKERRKFPRKVAIMLTDKFWEEGISYNIDAAGFQHN